MGHRLCILSDAPSKREAIASELGGIFQLTFLDFDHIHAAEPQPSLLLDINLSCRERLLELKQWLKSKPQNSKLVVVTDEASHRQAMQARALGATDIVHRPVDARALIATISGNKTFSSESAEEPAIRSPGVVNALQALQNIFSSATLGAPLDPVAISAAGEGIVSHIEEHGLRFWIDTVRQHHSQTYQHCLLVTGVAAAFGQHLGFSRADRHRLAFGGMLHDIGKAHVPVAILEKPTALDEHEIAVLRKHPELGLEALKNTPGLSPEMLDIVLHHHEYLNGSGYPHGLSGNEISDFVRIATICDTFGALLERRPYKPPIPADVAYQMLLDMGPKLDKDLMREFRFASTLRFGQSS